MTDIAAIAKGLTTEVDCPRCHEQCGWCSDYRHMHGRLTLPGTKQRCRVPGCAPEGDNCPVCNGSRRATRTVTYAPPRQHLQEQSQ